MATITSGIGLNTPDAFGSDSINVSIVVSATSTQFSWRSTTNELITLIGSFTYTIGTTTPTGGTITQLLFDNGNNGSTDLDVTYSNPIAVHSNLFSGNNNNFWNTVLQQADTLSMSGNAILFTFDGGNNGFGPAQSDVATIVGTGNYVGDFRDGRQFNLGPAAITASDTITVNKIAIGDVTVIGDVFAAATATGSGEALTTSDDTINDTSAFGGQTILIGDLNSVVSRFTVTGGNDTITGDSQSVTIIGDAYLLASQEPATPSSLIGGDDTLTGSSVGDIIVGDVYDADGGGLYTTGTVTGGNDTIDGGGGDDFIYGEYALNIHSVITGGDDIIDGGSGNDTIYGQEGDDVIDGGIGDDIVYGGNGNDRILRDNDGTPDNEYYGDNGVDTLVSTGLGSSITMNLETGEMRNTAGTLFDIIQGFENYEGGGSEKVIGTSGDNRITMSSSGGGNIIEAGAGNDIVEGGGGNDTLNGGDQQDTASYENALALVNVSLALQGQVQQTGGAGDDTLTNFENLIGSQHADTLTGDGNNNELKGGGASDTLLGGAGIDTAVFDLALADYAFSSSDSVDSGFRMTATVGNEGSDNLIDIEFVQFSDVTLEVTYGDLLANTMIGGTGRDILLGLAGNDFINASGGDDLLNGGNGDDTLLGGAGADVLRGGTNTAIAGQAQAGLGDTASYVTSDAIVLVNLVLNTGSGGHAEGDSLAGIENLIGSIYGDTLRGNNTANYLDGFNGNDNLFGNEGDDYLNGGNGDDTLDGGLGADFLNGGSGLGDRASYSSSNAGVNAGINAGAVNTGGHAEGDTLWVEDISGSSHNDNLIGNSVQNTLMGSNGDDFLNAGDNTDELFGGDGDDILIGGNGADLIEGGTNTAVGDTASYVNAGARIVGSLLTNTVTFSGNGTGDTLAGIENITGSAFDDFIYGDNTANTLDGFGGHDFIVGNDGVDKLLGGGGDDILDGGTGNDTLTGGSGIDTYDFNTFTFGQDTITDWQNGSDKLDFSNLNLDITDFTITQSGANTLLTYTFNPTQTVTLLAINMALIDAGDFVV